MIRKKISFKQACPTIDFTFELIKETKEYFPVTLIINILGEYRNGSIGDDDAKLIKGTIETSINIWQPRTVLLNLTELKYEWGDYIDYVFELEDEQKPFAFVVGPKCIPGLSSLFYGTNTEKDLIDNKSFFSSEEMALTKLLERRNGT